MHPIECAPIARRVEAVQEKCLQELSVLGFSARERAIDRSLEWVRRSCGVSGGVREEVGGIAHDRKTCSLDVSCFAVGIDERRQICALSQLPVHFGDGKAVILEKASALLERA